MNVFLTVMMVCAFCAILGFYPAIRNDLVDDRKASMSEATLSFRLTAFMNLLQDETGQDLIEYALVAALIALGAVVSMKTLSTKIAEAFTSVGTNLSSAV